MSSAVLHGAVDGAATVVACLLGDHPTGLLDDGTAAVPEFPFPEEAALALARVTGYAMWRAMPVGDTLELDEDAVERARALVAGALEANPDGVRLGPLDADHLVRTAGLNLVDQRVVDGADDAVAAGASSATRWRSRPAAWCSSPARRPVACRSTCTATTRCGGRTPG